MVGGFPVSARGIPAGAGGARHVRHPRADRPRHLQDERRQGQFRRPALAATARNPRHAE